MVLRQKKIAWIAGFSLAAFLAVAPAPTIALPGARQIERAMQRMEKGKQVNPAFFPFIPAFGRPSGAYQISRSLRFNAADSPRLDRVLSTLATNGNKKFTFSCWVKPTKFGTERVLLNFDGAGSRWDYFCFDTDDKLKIKLDPGGAPSTPYVSNRVFRDPTAWYHICLSIDTDQATQVDRCKVWVNGVLDTGSTNSFSSGQTLIATSGYYITIGSSRTYVPSWGSQLEGYLTEVYFIDGQALTYASFTDTDTASGIIVPKAYSGTYANNSGFWKFADNSGTTSTTLGKDSSGLGNNLTPTNFSVTAGIGNDSLLDTPTPYGTDAGLGGEIRGNYCTLNWINSNTDVVTVSNGGLDGAYGGGSYVAVVTGDFAMSYGKWKFSIKATALGATSGCGVGIVRSTARIKGVEGSNIIYNGADVYAYMPSGNKLNNGGGGAGVAYGGAWTAGDIIDVEFDRDAGTLTFYKQGVSQGTAFTGLTSGEFFPVAFGHSGWNYSFNFGQRVFDYAASSGFKCLCAHNLPDPAIKKGKDYFTINSYTGNGGSIWVGQQERRPDPNSIVPRSLRFNSADSAYLNRTPGAAGDQKKATISVWVKRSKLGTFQGIFSIGAGGGNQAVLRFDTNDRLEFMSYNVGGAAYDFRLVTTQVFKDTTAWVHIVAYLDAANTTARLYVNGTQVTTFDTNTQPTNINTSLGNTAAYSVGRDYGGSNYFDGYIAELAYCDGQALDASSFAETGTTGAWIPKDISGLTYGTVGFRLNFSDNSNTTSTTLGKDQAGSNNWTPNNFSVAAGSGNDSLLESPSDYGTDTGVGGEVRGNYATLNVMDVPSSATITNGALDGSYGINSVHPFSMWVKTGKWRWEITCVAAGGSNNVVGVCTSNINKNTHPWNTGQPSWHYNGYDGGWYDNGASNTLGAAWTTGDIIGVELDCDAGTLKFYKNGTAQGTIKTGTGLAGTLVAPHVGTAVSGAPTFSINTGQRPFAYSGTSDFKALCSANLSEPSTYWANGIKPDLLWLKGRSGATSHVWIDSGRGPTIGSGSDLNSAEAAEATVLSWSKYGALIGNNSKVNTLSATYVMWSWKKGVTPGYDEILYTGTGANQNVSHALSAVPHFIIVKDRGSVNPIGMVYHRGYGNGGAITLNSNAAPSVSALYWNNTTPTSSVITLGTGSSVNSNGAKYVAFAFTEVDGFSKFGTFTGSGTADGTFVWCGFRPAFLLIRNVGASGGQWVMIDNKRDTYNPRINKLAANNAEVENGTAVGTNTQNLVDFLSNGFKMRTSNGHTNEAGAAFVFAAFAENPFKYARAA
jgi:hypothetical protein